MDVCLGISRNRLYGDVERHEIPRDQWGEAKANGLIAEKILYSWRPPFQIACELPVDFTFQMECWVDRGGTRRFFPRPNLAEFLPWAALLGQKLLDDRGELVKRSPLSIDKLRFLHGFVQSTRAYIGETRAFGTSLEVSRDVRIDGEVEACDILPDSVGQNSAGEGERWPLDRFLDEGRKAAQSAGIVNPTPTDVLHYGLFRAAELAPIYPPLREIRGLIISNLFSWDSSKRKPNRSSINYVARQLDKILDERRHDTQEEFCRWQEDRKSDVIRRIEKKRDCPLDRQGVSRAILEIELEWLKVYVDCVDVAMRTFQKALPEPLKGYEKRFYQLIYSKHKRFGNFPFVILSERLDFCKVATLPVWNDPSNREAVGTFYRYVSYFPEMLDKRRSVDRRHKQGSVRRHEKVRQFAITDTQLKDAAQGLIESRLNRDLECTEWDVRIVRESLDAGGDEITLFVVCPDYEIEQEMSFRKDQLASAACDS